MRFYSIQLLRFFSAILVLLFHLDILKSGYKGVDIFFVISGFVMYVTLFLSERPTLYMFSINRLSKIFYLYWISLIVLYFVKPYALDFSFLQSLFLIPGHHSLLGVSWSLSYELYFYFIIGITAYLIPSRYFSVLFVFMLTGSFLIGVILIEILPIKSTPLNFFLGKNTLEFLLGILSGILLNFLSSSVRGGILLFLGLLSSGVLLFFHLPYIPSNSFHIVYGLLAMLIVSFLTAYESKNRTGYLFSRWSDILGNASYAIYLFGPIISAMIPGQNLLTKLTVIIITVFLSVLMNRFIENPALKKTREFLQ